MKFPLFTLALVLGCSTFAADIPRVLPSGEVPKDVRLEPLKDLNGYFPFTPPKSREAWAPRAEEVRMQVRVALGIWPEPTRTPLNAVVYGKVEGDGYTIEKVYFESMPGFFVTGSLFRPRVEGKHPAVLCPHGHWTDARFIVRGDAEMKKELESGGERFLESGRSMFQSLGIQLARMGIVAFVYDMLGNSDSLQISRELAHGFAKQRPEMNTVENWGLFSPQAETRVQSIAGLQTWNSIRIIDFLTTLPDVDASRIGCTGASGGGTQTLLLSVVDPRVTVECPAVMPSTAMQGGCTCENASLLRVGTGNIELVATFAPKPLGMTAANDWTKELETKGFPELQKHYALMGAPQNVALWAHLNFGHNYNIVSREHIYGWFNEHFHLGLSPEKLKEQEHPVLPREQMTVWDEQHPQPPKGDDFERKLLRWWDDDARSQLVKAPEVFEKIARPAWKTIIGWTERNVDDTGAGQMKKVAVSGQGKSYLAFVWMMQPKDGSKLPVLGIDPPKGNGRVVLWLSERGKAGLFSEGTELRPEVCRLLEAGYKVVGADLFEQGEFLPDGKTITQTRRVQNPREAACFTFGYNRALFAQRAADVCDLLAGLSHSKEPTGRSVVALDGTGPLAAAALAVFTDSIDKAVINTGGFRFGKVLDLQSPDFLPGAAKYGDIGGALALARVYTKQVLVLGEGKENSDPVGWLLEH
ncbi:MAG: acetylxylan esterase [Chthoniobacter sp.]|uniref:acetylxylan esterase n=1 Tax=Chthoniobacter sp. TaxID=2510640 RepID=UPI0032AABA4A